MAYQKVIPVGSAGSVTISEDGGTASVKVSLSEQAGGGNVVGFAKASLSAELDVSAAELVDAGLAIAAAKYPAAAALIDGVKAIIDSEMAKA